MLKRIKTIIFKELWRRLEQYCS